jgi:hypothetical protein
VALAIILLAVIPLIYKYSTGSEKPIPKKEIKTNQFYGEFLTWDKVNHYFPKFAYAKIIDYDTHLTFNVQRRGGSNHADVQPLTASDTAIMKKIYNGKWSWKRKAVIVQLDNGKKIAGSMHGMPHGQGAIKNNNFNGHFCIHFRDSKTHGSRMVDLAHQIMIWKSANILNQKLKALDQKQIIEVFVTAIDQGEINIAGKVIYSEKDVRPLLKELSSNIGYVRIGRIEKIKGNNFKVDLNLVLKDSKNEINKKVLVIMRRINDCWKIDLQSVKLIAGSI